jgi:hypothetical protein
VTLTGKLTGSSGPDFSFVVTQKLGVSLDEVLPNDILANGVGKLSSRTGMSAHYIIVMAHHYTHLDKVIGEHVPDPPTLIDTASLQTLTQLGLDLGLLQLRADGDQVRDGQQSDGILIVVRETLVKRDDLGFEDGGLGRESLGVGLRRGCVHLVSFEHTNQCVTSSLTPRALAAARLTIGVSSVAKSLNKPRISVCPSLSTKG